MFRLNLHACVLESMLGQLPKLVGILVLEVVVQVLVNCNNFMGAGP